MIQNKILKPTLLYSSELQQAYDFFNKAIFHGELPECIIVLCNTNKKVLGYYHQDEYLDITSSTIVDKIALNPQFFASRGLENTLSTLVHEMCHLWRWRCCGKPPRAGYHCKKWASKMKEVGLYPSDTGVLGGKETGQRVSHFILACGPFKTACQSLLDSGFLLTYMHKWQFRDTCLNLNDSELLKAKPELKEIISVVDTTATPKHTNKSNRIKYTCEACCLNIWGKPGLILICGSCRNEFKPELIEQDEE